MQEVYLGELKVVFLLIAQGGGERCFGLIDGKGLRKSQVGFGENILDQK